MFAEMPKEKAAFCKAIAAVLLAVLALASALWLAKFFSSPEFHKDSIAALDEKKVTVMELTAATAITSVAISAVPGDATTPIADQIAELSSYLMVVAGVIMLEKFLLAATGQLAFAVLIPIACALGVAYLCWQRPAFKQLALRLAAFAVAICLVIPASIHIGELFEETFRFQQTVESATKGAETLEEEAGEETGEEAGQNGSIKDWFAGLGEQISGGVNDAIEKAEAVLGDFIDAVAVLLISNCVIPVLVLFLFVWLLKAVVSVPLDGPRPQRTALPPAGQAPRS